MARLYEYRDESLYCHHSRDENPDPERFDMHAHERMELLYFINVEGHYLVEGHSYPVRSGDLFIMRPAETHKLIVDPNVPYERIAIHFSSRPIEALDPESSLLRPFMDRPLGLYNRYDGSLFTNELWRRAFDSFDFSSSADERAHILGRLFLLLPELCDAFDSISDRRHTAVDSSASELVAYINEHLFEPLSLQSLSEEFYRSPSQIGRIFRQAVGSSLWNYVLVKRLLAARALIEQGENAGNAAASCGFNDYSSFFRAYKNHFGHSPSDDLGKEMSNTKK